MSLILEALKKSEQQRRLGEAPNLSSPVVATRRRHGVLPVLVILIVAAAGIAWWLSRRAPTPPPAAPPPVAANNAGTTMSSMPQTRPAAPSAGNRTTPDRTAAMRAAPKADQDKRVGAPANAPSATPPATASVQTRPAAAAPIARGTPTIDKSAGLRAPVSPPSTVSGEKRETAVSGEVKKPDSGAQVAPTRAKAAPPAQEKTATSGDALPTVWELPYATRKDLPALDLSMHVYSPDPKQRFVVLKGDRHVEGDEIGQDLILREIRQDGLVLDYKGTKFFFPRSGR